MTFVKQWRMGNKLYSSEMDVVTGDFLVNTLAHLAQTHTYMIIACVHFSSIWIEQVLL